MESDRPGKAEGKDNMGNTNISYLTETWNITEGCSPVSPACDHCYAARITQRFHPDSNLVTDGEFNGKVIIRPDKLDEPLHWRKPRRVGVCFMSDLFHEAVPDTFLVDVFFNMVPPHSYFLLTKRSKRMWKWIGHYYGKDFSAIFPDVWAGVTVESPDQLYRLDDLRLTPAAHKWVSIEPMLSEIDLTPYLDFLDWVVFGGESGVGARFFDANWISKIQKQCADAGVPCYFKQYGSFHMKGKR